MVNYWTSSFSLGNYIDVSVCWWKVRVEGGGVESWAVSFCGYSHEQGWRWEVEEALSERVPDLMSAADMGTAM